MVTSPRPVAREPAPSRERNRAAPLRPGRLASCDGCDHIAVFSESNATEHKLWVYDLFYPALAYMSNHLTENGECLYTNLTKLEGHRISVRTPVTV
jgi:hypothetical protein